MTNHQRPVRRGDSRPLSLLQRLRLETRDEHVRLETGLAITAAPSNRQRYAGLLERFHGIHVVHEPMLDALFADDRFWPPRADWNRSSMICVF